MENRFIGSLYGHGAGYAGAVWDKHGIAPTLTTMQGGGREPMIIELGHIEKGTGKHQSNVVYSHQGECPALCAVMGDKQPSPMHVEVKRIVAMRGRDKDNPSDRTAGNPNLEQRLEINSEGICNTITTVQKDNMVMELENFQEDECEPINEDFVWEVDGEKFYIRIRKLTPRECWRLMDFTDEDFEKAQAVNSNTQLYKQAGNSIVKNVLCEALRPLFE